VWIGASGRRTHASSFAVSTHQQKSDIGLEEDLPEEEGVISVPWPCETKVLVVHIEAALLDVPAASTTSTIQQDRKG
jgi:hypothetical protein